MSVRKGVYFGVSLESSVMKYTGDSIGSVHVRPDQRK